MAQVKKRKKSYKPRKNKKTRYISGFISGERGIRTPGPVTVNGFQDRRNRPLCHLSGYLIGRLFLTVANIQTFFLFPNFLNRNFLRSS